MNKVESDKLLIKIDKHVAVIEERLHNPCPVGIKNTTAIKWIWICGSIVTAGFVIVIKYFHGGK